MGILLSRKWREEAWSLWITRKTLAQDLMNTPITHDLFLCLIWVPWITNCSWFVSIRFSYCCVLLFFFIDAKDLAIFQVFNWLWEVQGKNSSKRCRNFPEAHLSLLNPTPQARKNVHGGHRSVFHAAFVLLHEVFYPPNGSGCFFCAKIGITFLRTNPPLDWLTEFGELWVPCVGWSSGGIARKLSNHNMQPLPPPKGRGPNLSVFHADCEQIVGI